jgi:hypothetical protein
MTTKSSKSKKVEITLCSVCNRPLSDKNGSGMGHLCARYIARGLTSEKLAERLSELTVEKVPAGYIKVADLDRKIKSLKGKFPGLTVNRMVTAIGRDRCPTGPVHPIAQVLYDRSRTRWVNGWLGTQSGLKAIATLDFSKAPKAPAPKAE